MKIYTKTGDQGETGLYDGTRAPKSDLVFDVLGALDELSAHIGLLIFHLRKQNPKGDFDNVRNFFDNYKEVIKYLREIQQTLLNIGSIIATPNPKEGQKLPVIVYDQVEKIEKEIDTMTQELEPLTVFILQGGNTALDSQAHVCRTVTRRAEREIIKYSNIDENIIKYMNRLSDYFFTFARYYSM